MYKVYWTPVPTLPAEAVSQSQVSPPGRLPMSCDRCSCVVLSFLSCRSPDRTTLVTSHTHPDEYSCVGLQSGSALPPGGLKDRPPPQTRSRRPPYRLLTSQTPHILREMLLLDSFGQAFGVEGAGCWGLGCGVECRGETSQVHGCSG